MGNRRLTDQLLDATVQTARLAANDQSATVRIGTVVSASDSAQTIVCSLAGVTLRDIPCMDGFAPQPGDVVWLLHQSSTLVAIGTFKGAGGWDDLRTPMTRIATGANAPTWSTFRDGLNTYSFDAGTMNQGWFEIQLPHGWAAGSSLKPHIHWSPGNSVNTGSVRWGLEYSWANAVNPPGNVFPASTTIYTLQAAGGTPYQQQIASFGSISGVGMRLSSVLMARIFRDAANAADTFTGPAFGISIDVHHQVSSDGSSQEFPSI